MDISMKAKKENYHLIYGFEKEFPVNKGYISICKNKNGSHGIYDIVEDEDMATEFSDEKIKSAFSFISTEPELSNWKFHVVKRFKNN